MCRTLERIAMCDKELVNKLHALYLEGIKEYSYNGIVVNTDSDRYANFYHNGFACKSCGIVGSFAAIERTFGSNEKYHVNIYGFDDKEEQILMTKDHIFPSSKGGINDIKNYQVLCEKCNHSKGIKTNLSLQEALNLGLIEEEYIFNAISKVKQANRLLCNTNVKQLENNMKQLKKHNTKLKSEVASLKKELSKRS